MLVLKLHKGPVYLLDQISNGLSRIQLVGNQKIGIKSTRQISICRGDRLTPDTKKCLNARIDSDIYVPGLHNLIGEYVRGLVCGTSDVEREGVVVSVLGKPPYFERLLIESIERDFFVLVTNLTTSVMPPPAAKELLDRIQSHPDRIE